MTDDIHKYLTLDEERNAMDNLAQSLTFLSMVEQNIYYLKWFIISFNGTIYSFILLVLQNVNQNQIYEVLPKFTNDKEENVFDPFDGKLISFIKAYEYLKSSDKTKGHEFISSKDQDTCMKELNSKLRNQMIHFKPMTSAYEPWYPASVCLPLLEILRFCIKTELLHFSHEQVISAYATLNAIEILLIRHGQDT